MKFKASTYITISILIFIASCCLPAVTFKLSSGAFTDSSSQEVKWGIEFLAYGPIGILFGDKSSTPWLANVFYVMGIYCLATEEFKKALTFSSIGLLLGAVFPLFSYMSPMPQDEGGVMHARFQSAEIGFILWIVALGIIPLISYIKHNNNKKTLGMQFIFEYEKPNKSQERTE